MRTGGRVGLAVIVALAGVLTSGCEPGDDPERAPGWYKAREAGVALRNGGADCAASPGTGNCPDVLLGLKESQRVYPICQRQGQLVGSNPWWLYADGPRGRRGWVSSWYLDHPSNRLPGVPDCTASMITPR